MFASSRTLLSVLAVLVVSSRTSNAFVQKSTFQSFGVSKAATSSSLNMLAEDPKVILVTGSSRGLGKSIAVDIGSHGHKIIVNYVSDSSKESAEETVAEIKAAGGDAVAIQADCKCSFWETIEEGSLFSVLHHWLGNNCDKKTFEFICRFNKSDDGDFCCFLDKF